MTATISIRWANQRDLGAMASATGWTVEQLRASLRQRNVIGYVVECEERILGAAVYRLMEGRVELLAIGIMPGYIREGIGRLMVERLKKKTCDHKRELLAVVVPERNLAAQQFFRACGLRAVAVVEGGYLMEWRRVCEE